MHNENRPAKVDEFILLHAATAGLLICAKPPLSEHGGIIYLFMRTLQIHREDVMFRSWKDDNDIGGMSSQWNKQFSDVPRHDFGLNQATCDCYRMLSPVSPSLSQRDNHHNEELHSSKYSMETERLVPSTSDFEFNSDPIQRRSSHGSRIRCATPWILLFTVTLLWAGSYLQLRATYESSHQSPYSQCFFSLEFRT